MSDTFAVGLRACCVALSLLLAVAHAADPVSPLIGQTRDQLLSRYGEPKSQIATGSRVVFFYPRERIVLRDNIVVEVEELAAEPAVTPPAASGVSQDAAGTASPANAAPTAGAPESKVEIKLVLPPSSKSPRPAIPEPDKPAPKVPPVPTPVVPEMVPPPTTPADSTAVSVAPIGPAVTPGPVVPAEKPPSPASAPGTGDTRPVAPENVTPQAGAKKRPEAPKAAPPQVQPPPPPAPEAIEFSERTFWIALAVVAGGVGLLLWRYRQRRLELAASSVEGTSLATAPAAPVSASSSFTAELLGTLDAKRFEELVAAYYNKTGVVAVRTKAAPDTPVQIKISWKGEPRPFAYVQCIANPPAPVDAKPLHALMTTLTTDDIRRGYVVTNGKFNNSARHFAEEKHLTLVPGDIFLEKLNALPSPARAEIMRAIAAEDASRAGPAAT